MNIGILTLYKVRNLGACLQATAMKQILENYGHHVNFLKGYDAVFAKQLFKNDMGRLKPWTIPFLLQKEYKFQKYFSIFPEVELSESNKMDGVIIGSDSLWVADYGKNSTPPTFFGDINCGVVCSYAPSVGRKYDLSKYSHEQLEALKKIKYITVRDSMSQKFIKEITGEDCSIVIDPTLLCNWDSFLKNTDKIKKSYDYILTYGGFDGKTADAIKRIAQKKGLEVINVGTFNRFFKRSIAVSPDELLNYINGARYVITSMFHGVMLSIALGKQFRYVTVDSNRDIKIVTTIDRLHLNFVMLKREDLWRSTDIFAEKINYTETNSRIDEVRTASKKELEKILEMMHKVL